MSKKELQRMVSENASISIKDASQYIDVVFDVIADQLFKTGEAMLPGIGKLVTKERAGRKGRNPKTGEAIDIPFKTTIKLKISKGMKDKLNNM
jgi:nucleoid DNA-binding protein